MMSLNTCNVFEHGRRTDKEIARTHHPARVQNYDCLVPKLKVALVWGYRVVEQAGSRAALADVRDKALLHTIPWAAWASPILKRTMRPLESNSLDACLLSERQQGRRKEGLRHCLPMPSSLIKRIGP